MRSLEQLSNEELQALLGAILAKVKDARKKSVQAISKHEDLQTKWIKNLSALPVDSPEEAQARRQEAFEEALVRYPEAFINYTIANHLTTFERACREQQMTRASKGKKK